MTIVIIITTIGITITITITTVVVVILLQVNGWWLLSSSKDQSCKLFDIRSLRAPVEYGEKKC
jgi:hypothetical protein